MTIQIKPIEQGQLNYKHICFSLDDELDAVWCELRNQPHTYFTHELLDELNHAQMQANNIINDYRFQILCSSSNAVFSLGGDLNLFHSLILQKDRKNLYQYMKKCIDVLCGLTILPSRERIALVQGMAFGGGFEAALGCDTIIAENSATFGFPERLFNLFPGMGAYSFLLRRIEPVKAQKMIKSARTYTAKELYDMGVIDVLVSDGDGKEAVREHIKHYQRYSNSFDAFNNVIKTVHPVLYNEVLSVGEQWVEAAMRLSSRDIGLIARLAESQQKRNFS
ncbi:MAG: crotonase/enoyl-CoA hydratase family protein [Gammaproteobacteria bacterium]|nr:crotonase/enoyl-CoA hydratase family protein [Gammaproteobacteria bacterium]MDH5654219.1 crotonase/enoyl-CoA hydratase family protein [Gammaproteobacteria bacterium]